MMDYSEDYYNGIAGIYFRRVLRTIISMGKLRKRDGLILDFGCGVGHLKAALPTKHVIGYDIIKEVTDVDDYKHLKPEVIVCNAVLEHLSLDELKEVVSDFKTMNRDVLILTALPTENFISKIGMVLTGYTTAHDDHKITLKQATNYLLSQCDRVGRKKIFTMMEVSAWRFKKSE